MLSESGMHRESVLRRQRLTRDRIQRCTRREKSGDMDHVSTKRVAEVVARLVQDDVVRWAAVRVHDEDPAKALLAERRRQIHVHRTKGRWANRVAAGKVPLLADLVGAAGP